MLAVLLTQNGYNVTLCTYHKYQFFENMLNKSTVSYICIPSRNIIKRLVAVRKLIKKMEPDIIISFLATPNLVAELTNLTLRRRPLIVSERNTFPAGMDLGKNIRLNMHRLADRVVTNSYEQKRFIDHNARYLENKTLTIHNCVDLVRFHPSNDNQSAARNDLVVVGRLEPQKNPLIFIEAIASLHSNIRNNVTVKWYGNNFFKNDKPTAKSFTYQEALAKINTLSLNTTFKIHQPTQDIVSVYRQASVVCVPSLWEGCSNVICEAMACGKPVLASRSGDNALLVEDGVTGLLFDARSPSEIAGAITRFVSMSIPERIEMGRKARQRAEAMLSPSHFVEKYMDLISNLSKNHLH